MIEMKSFWRADSTEGARVPVAQPRLPTFDQIAPYLRRIDGARWYTNGGPLLQEFEERLALHCGGGRAQVATVANATLGLALALLASDLPSGTLCMVPSWTFAATGHAILLAGLVPWIVDVSRETWALEAAEAREFLTDAPGLISAVIPVSPFGAPINLEPWRNFREATGIAVIADAAAAFDSLRASEIPAVVSLHATKVCGIGEGGFVVSTERAFAEEIQKRANFGFWNSRESTARSFNGKLAGSPWLSAESGAGERPFATGIRRELGHIHRLGRVATSDADMLTRVLSENGIASRRWWGGGLHQHRSFQSFPRHRVAQTEAMAARVVGLPCWRDLPNDSIEEVCALLLSSGV